jgi:hypothetical protein
VENIYFIYLFVLIFQRVQRILEENIYLNFPRFIVENIFLLTLVLKSFLGVVLGVVLVKYVNKVKFDKKCRLFKTRDYERPNRVVTNQIIFPYDNLPQY